MFYHRRLFSAAAHHSSLLAPPFHIITRYRFLPAHIPSLSVLSYGLVGIVLVLFWRAQAVLRFCTVILYHKQ